MAKTVKGVTYNPPIATEDFEEYLSPNPGAKPKWEKIIESLGYKENVKATISIDKIGSLTGTQKPVDIMINKIDQVEWVTQPQAATSMSALNMAELVPYGDGYRTFPEMPEPNGFNYNNVEVSITLALAIPDGMEATVWVDWYDPNNAISDEQPQSRMRHQRDNWGEIVVSVDHVKFTAAERSKRIRLEITQAQPGDNYIIAAHPNDGVAGTYVVETKEQYDKSNYTGVAGRTLLYPEPSDLFYDCSELPTSLHTSVLTVWRTLWIERCQMTDPADTDPAIGNHGFDPDEQYIPGRNDERGDIDQNTWMIGTLDSAPEGEPEDFDVRFQPPMPEISHLIPELRRACIEVKEVMEEDIESWGLEIRNPPAFLRNLPGTSDEEAINGTIAINEPCRSVRNPGKNFWCIHAIGAYEDQTNKSHDPGLGVIGRALRVATASPVVQRGIFLVFNETIRDFVSTKLVNERGKDREVKRDVPEFQQLVVLHEVLHLFGFEDYKHIENEEEKTQEYYNFELYHGPIMTNEWFFSDTCEEYLVLSPYQIQHLQAQDYPH